MQTPRLFSLLITLLSAGQALATLTLNPALPITKRVWINPIISVKSDGGAAVYFGSDSQALEIKQLIKNILAQSGIDAHFLPERRIVSNFIYNGAPIDYTTTKRPTGDLNTIVATANAPNFKDRDVINLYLVRLCPGFNILTENTANGLAFIDSNGISAHIGVNLLGFLAGREVIAAVIAHEIGHNLGLSHTANSTANLMSPSGTSAQITAAQTTTIFTNNNGFDGFDFAKDRVTGTPGITAWLTDNAITSGNNGDDDGDGISNLSEFLFGLDPKRADSQLAPQLIVPLTANTSITLLKDPSALDAGFTYNVQNSNNLTQWFSQNQTGGKITSSVNNTIQLQATLLKTTETRNFFRVKASTPPSLSLTAARSATIKQATPTVSTALFEAQPAPIISDCAACGCGLRHAFASP